MLVALCITIHKQKTYMCENNILWSSTWCILSIFQFWNFFAHFIHIAVPRITVFTRKQVDLFWGFPLFQQYLYWSLSYTYSNYYPLNSPSENICFIWHLIFKLRVNHHKGIWIVKKLPLLSLFLDNRFLITTLWGGHRGTRKQLQDLDKQTTEMFTWKKISYILDLVTVNQYKKEYVFQFLKLRYILSLLFSRYLTFLLPRYW